MLLYIALIYFLIKYNIMFIDWLTIFQDHDTKLPFLGDTREIVLDVQSGEQLTERQPAFKHEGSFSTSLSIRISGNRVTVKGNPSKINRLDNLFGFTSIDQCVSVYNDILIKLGLPAFTRCTTISHTTGKDGKKAHSFSNGATVQELHITTNKSVGQGNVSDYLRALSSQRYRNSIPRLHSNGTTLDWLSKKGNASLIYPSIYDKAHEIALHQLDKIKRLHGVESVEYKYLKQVESYCLEQGVVRFEQKLKSRFIRRENLQFWGIADYSILTQIHNEFLSIDNIKGMATMTYQTIAQLLKQESICKSTASANATASYYFMWLHGESFDLSKSAVKTHRARLRRLDIDIAEICDITKYYAIKPIDRQEIEVQQLPIPDWYKQPSVNHLRLVA